MFGRFLSSSSACRLIAGSLALQSLARVIQWWGGVAPKPSIVPSACSAHRLCAVHLAVSRGCLYVCACGVMSVCCTCWCGHPAYHIIRSTYQRTNGRTAVFVACTLCLGSRVVSVLDSGAEGPAFKSQSRRCRVTVLGKLFTPIVSLFTKQQNW